MPSVASPHCAGRLAMEIFDRLADGQIGTIVGTFRNTIYVRTIDDELVCITSHDVKGPVNVNIENNINFSVIRVREPVFKVNKILKVDDIQMSLRNVPIYESSKQMSIAKGLEKRVVGAINLLAILAIEGSILDSKSPFFERLSEAIRGLVSVGKQGSSIDLQSPISKIIGLGIGSTPSGDDLLAGFLYCLRQISVTTSFDLTRIKIESKTGWHSAKFIEYAHAGFVIQPLEKFVNALLSGSEETTNDSLLDLSRIGYSSGLDAALGVAIAASIKTDDDCRNLILKKLGL